MSSFDDFFNAIAGQESGGNYKAVNQRTGALGRYQILPSNIPAWSKKYLGYSISANQFLNSAQLQDNLAKAVLQSYYNQWGARGAASAWYSGSPSGQGNYTRFNSNEPSIGEYVDQVLARMGGSGSYGYTAQTGPTIDHTVKNTPLSDIYKQDQQAQPIDALAGTDVKGLGLGQLNTDSLAANTGGVGTDAPKVESPTGDQQAKPTAAQVAESTGALVTEAKQRGLTGRRQQVIDLASQYLGTPYVWGGHAPGGFDCSGLVQYAMSLAGINIGRTSWQQLASGQRTGLNQLQPGDLVGFGDGHHVAIWLGGGRILEAPHTGADVRIRTLGKNEGAWGVSLANLYG